MLLASQESVAYVLGEVNWHVTGEFANIQIVDYSPGRIVKAPSGGLVSVVDRTIVRGGNGSMPRKIPL